MLQLAQPSDREVVNALAEQVHAMHVQWRPDVYETVEQMYSEPDFQEAIQKRQLYVAKLEGQPVGFVHLAIRPFEGPGMVRRKVMMINSICVEESCRNHGIGTEMMADVRALAKAFGCTGMQLGVYPQNDAAVAFYQKCGFTISSIAMQSPV